MKLVKVAAAALNQTPLDWYGNRKNIVRAIELARKQKASLLCLPELCISGYGCEDYFHSTSVYEMSQRMLLDILPETIGMVVSVGLPVMYGHAVYNGACLIVDGEIAGFVCKKDLAGDGIHYEPRWFKPWPEDVRTQIEIEGKSYPFGDIYFDVGGVNIGFEICEEAWTAKRRGSELAGKVDIFLDPSASHFAFGKSEIRKRLVQEGSRAFNAIYVYSNLLGCESGRIIYDGDNLIASGGKLLANAPRFSFRDVVITSAVVDISAVRMSHAKVASFQPEYERELSAIKNEFQWPQVDLGELVKSEFFTEEWEESTNIKEEEFTRATTLALFDYMRKSKAQGYVVSLSGGADSTAVTVLVSLMVQFGIKELGIDDFHLKLSHINKIQDKSEPNEIIKEILTTLYQATRNSSNDTRESASTVANHFGTTHLEFNIDPLFDEYTNLISDNIGRPLEWTKDDIALQNLQARIRSPLAWALTNIENKLLLTTSNRSEADVGYATMDGDTSGGLCPIGGIDKAFVIEWLKWMERSGPVGFGSIPALGIVNALKPSAELRPQEYHQTDEADLMPYPVLVQIESASIRDKRPPLEVFLLMRALYKEQYTEADILKWVERFFRLWSINQWKRERYAPSFHLDDRNVDPKTWCRFPILNGGFKAELEELRDFVKRERADAIHV
jgi:NAD+ synthase (glutamine-hydrolysing)